MKTKELLWKLSGIHTIESIMSKLNIEKQKAVYLVHRLRKHGYVKTKMLSDKKRVYNIAFSNKLKTTSYTEIINQNSPIKIATLEEHKIYGRQPSLEETLVFAIKTKSLKMILASIALFKKIKNWKLLYKLAKQNNVERQVGALYDLAGKFMKKRKMSRVFLRNSLPKKTHKFRYFIQGLKSKDYIEIEKKWRIYLPFNKEDLEEYK